MIAANVFVLTESFNMRLTCDMRCTAEIRLSVLKYSIAFKFYNIRKTCILGLRLRSNNTEQLIIKVAYYSFDGV